MKDNGFKLNKFFILMLSILVISLFLISCTPKLSDEEVITAMQNLSEEEVDAIVADDSALAGQASAKLGTSKVNSVYQSIDKKKEISCSETDNGQNIYVKGTATAIYGKGSIKQEDKCFQGGNGVSGVTEYYCYQNVLITSNQFCPEGYECNDGACKQSLNVKIPCDLQADNTMDITKVISAIPNQNNKNTTICFAPGDYKQNIKISDKINLILKAEGIVNFIEPDTTVSTKVAYYGAALEILNSNNIVLDGISIINNHVYDYWYINNEGHRVTIALHLDNAINIVGKNVKIIASGKNAVSAEKSTLNILNSKISGLYFFYSASNSAIYSENTSFQHIPGDGHPNFYPVYSDLTFKDSTFIFETDAIFLAGYNDPQKNKIIVENPTVISVNGKKMTALIIQHPNLNGLVLYWLGELPGLYVNPAERYFGDFYFDPFKDPNTWYAVGPSGYVKLCKSGSPNTVGSGLVNCIECQTPQVSINGPGKYSEAFSTTEEYQNYLKDDCKSFEENPPQV